MSWGISFQIHRPRNATHFVTFVLLKSYDLSKLIFATQHHANMSHHVTWIVTFFNIRSHAFTQNNKLMNCHYEFIHYCFVSQKTYVGYKRFPLYWTLFFYDFNVTIVLIGLWLLLFSEISHCAIWMLIYFLSFNENHVVLSMPRDHLRFVSYFIWKWLIDWLRFNVLWRIFHEFQEDDDSPIEQTLLCTGPTRLKMLDHKSNSSQVGTPPYSDTFCITPDQPVVTFPPSISHAWRESSGYQFLSFWCHSVGDRTNDLTHSMRAHYPETTEAVIFYFI